MQRICKFPHLRSPSHAGLLLLLLISHSLSHGHPDENYDLFDFSLEELTKIPISSASMFVENIWTAPASVSRIYPEEWQRYSAKRLSDTVAHIPATLPLPIRFGADAIAVRGFAGSNLPRGISLMLDGIPLNGLSNGAALVSLPNFELGTLEHVEWVKGPASALYGSDAFSGTLALTTYSPHASTTPTGAVDADLGVEDYFQLAGRFQMPLTEHMALTSSLATSSQGDQHREYQYTDPQNGAADIGSRGHEYESSSGFIKIINDADPARHIDLGLYWNNFDADKFPGPGRSQSPGRSLLEDQDWSGSDTDFIMGRAFVTQKLSQAMTAELKLFTWQADVEQITKVPRNDEIGENQAEVTDLRHGGQLALRGHNANTQWALATGYDSFEVKEGYFTSLAADGSILDEGNQPFHGETREILSLLGEAKTDVHEYLRVIYGGRIEHYDDFGTQANPRISIIYQSMPKWIVKLLYGRAFRAPTAFELRGIGGLKGNPELNPEIIDTVEWVTTITTIHGYINMTFFHSEWRDAIVRVPIIDPMYRLEFINAERNQSDGFETTYHFEKNAWWANTGFSYVESKNLSLDRDYAAFPKVMLNLGVGYKNYRHDWNIFVNNRVLIDMTEGANRTLAPHDELPTYWRVDLHAEKSLNRHLRMSLNIRNLFDRENNLPSIFSAENGIPDDAFSFGVGARYVF